MWSLVLLVGALSQNCPTFSCHEGGFDISPVCGTLSPEQNIVLQACDNSTAAYCDVTGTITNNYTCALSPPYPQRVQYPGERCFENSDCITQSCVDSYCQGQNAGGSCTRNADCNVGYYCSPGFYCARQVSYGETCSHDYMCQNNLACNRTLFEDGQCVYYFSIPVGQPVGMCIDMLTEGVSNLCASGTCTLLSQTDSIGVCSGVWYAPSLTYPRICTSDSQCQGIDGLGNSTVGTCSCGMDMHGFAYCDALSGDPPAQTLQYLYELHVNSTGITQCHTQRRFEYECLTGNLGSSAVSLVETVKQLSTDTARYQGNDFCVKTIFNNQFHNQGPAAYQCKAYGCAFLAGWEDGTCITYTQGSNAFAINPCSSASSSPYCDYTKAENNKWRNVTCGTQPVVIVRYPGEVCSQNSDCVSNNCTNGLCKGTQAGLACGSTTECEVGLYCVSKDYRFTCQSLIAVYNYGCGSDFDCLPYAGCKLLQDGPPGMCVPYFSLTNGTSTTCNNGVSLLCSSGSCYGTGYTGLCTTAPVSKQALATPCRMNGDCSGSNSYNYQFHGVCTCGYNNKGSSYCQPFLGDEPGVAYLKMLKKHYKLGGGVEKCNSARRFSEDCYSGFEKNFTWTYLNYTMFPMLVNNDQCVRAVYTWAYWKDVPSPPSPPDPPGPSPEPKPTPKPLPPPYTPGDDPKVIVKHDFAALLIFASVMVLV